MDRQAHHVGALRAEAVQDGDRIGDRPRLAIGGGIGGNVGGRVPARGVREAPVGTGEVPDLRLPASVVAGELVDEQQRRSGAGGFRVQRDAVVGVDHGHR
jgi:hypothetical protein